MKNFNEMLAKIKNTQAVGNVAVVAAHDLHTLEAIASAQKGGMITSTLIGDKKGIEDGLKEIGQDSKDYDIVDSDSNEKSLMIAIEKVHAGKAQAIMKGKMETSEIMRAVLSKQNNMNQGGLISLVGFFEVPAYHKMIAISDIAINLYPNLGQKQMILANAVSTMTKLGFTLPKVAVLAAVERENPKMPETVDAAQLKRLNQEGIIQDCIVEGPISFDLATSAESAAIKGYISEVSGDADLLIVPDIVSGNVLAKALTGFANGKTAGVVVGAKVPIILTSRSAEASDKYHSIILAAYAGGN